MEIYTRKVQYYETDKMGITHHSNYIRWMEEARTDYLEKIGWPFEKLEEMGYMSPVVRVECDYKNTSTYADIITIEVLVEKLTGAKFRVGYTMKDQNGKLLVKGATEHCFIRNDGTLVRFRTEMPEFYKALQADVQE